jgi:hypothetical protein
MAESADARASRTSEFTARRATGRNPGGEIRRPITPSAASSRNQTWKGTRISPRERMARIRSPLGLVPHGSGASVSSVFISDLRGWRKFAHGAKTLIVRSTMHRISDNSRPGRRPREAVRGGSFQTDLKGGPHAHTWTLASLLGSRPHLSAEKLKSKRARARTKTNTDASLRHCECCGASLPHGRGSDFATHAVRRFTPVQSLASIVGMVDDRAVPLSVPRIPLWPISLSNSAV